MAIVVPWAGVLVAGDYLSPVEIPMLNEGGGRGRVPRDAGAPAPAGGRRARTSSPGTGRRSRPRRPRAILEQDAPTCSDLGERGADAVLPEGRRSHEMLRVHERNALKVAAG